jgi:DNA repair protein RadC
MEQLVLLDLVTMGRTQESSARLQVSRAEKAMQKLHRIQEELNAIYENPSQRPQILSPQTCDELLRPFFEHLDHEEFWVLVLDIKNRVKKIVKLYQGTVSSSNIRIAEIFRQAIIENSPTIVIAHNHPSGDPTPSPEDIVLTRAIIEAGKFLDIKVLDHLIIGKNRYLSFKQEKLADI